MFQSPFDFYVPMAIGGFAGLIVIGSLVAFEWLARRRERNAWRRAERHIGNGSRW